MTLGTHVAFASVLYLGGANLFGYRPDGISWALAAIASLLPDIDLPPARIGRLFWFVSVPLERRFGHRTLTHSALGLAMVALLAAPLGLLNPLYCWAVVGGYWSHLWLDMLNLRGIDLFWPSPIRVVTPGNRNWRLEVAARGDDPAVRVAGRGGGASSAQPPRLPGCPPGALTQLRHRP